MANSMHVLEVEMMNFLEGLELCGPIRYRASNTVDGKVVVALLSKTGFIPTYAKLEGLDDLILDS